MGKTLTVERSISIISIYDTLVPLYAVGFPRQRVKQNPAHVYTPAKSSQFVSLAAYLTSNRFHRPLITRFTYSALPRNGDALRPQTFHLPQLKTPALHFSPVPLVRSNKPSAIMPPKQATLGYVKSSQQTLGCMHPENPTSSRCLTIYLSSKFFGQQQNGPKPKPQQSTLAFNPPKASKSADAKNDKVDGVQASGMTKDKPSEGIDLNGDVVTNLDLESEQFVTNDYKERVEAKTGSEESGGEDDVMVVDQPSTDDVLAETPGRAASEGHQRSSPKRSNSEINDEGDEDEEPVKKRSRRTEPQDKHKQPAKKVDAKNPPEPSKTNATNSKNMKVDPKSKARETTSGRPPKPTASLRSRHLEEADGQEAKPSEAANGVPMADESSVENEASEVEDDEPELDEEDEEKPEVAAKAREKVQATLKSIGKDPYPDWPPGEPVPYAALCTTFSLIEMTTKRLVISAHCSLFLRQVLRLTPQDLLPTVQLMINKLAADYAGIELGIGESLIMKAIGETTGRSLQVIKADQNEIGDLGLVAAKSRSNQPTMFKPKPLTVRGVLEGLMNIAVIQGDGSQGRKIAGIKKLLSTADAAIAGKGSKGVDITKDKGGASEAKFIVRFLEGKLRLGLAEKTVLIALAHAMVIHETEEKGNKLSSSEQLANGESILKTVYRWVTASWILISY